MLHGASPDVGVQNQIWVYIGQMIADQSLEDSLRNIMHENFLPCKRLAIGDTSTVESGYQVIGYQLLIKRMLSS